MSKSETDRERRASCFRRQTTLAWAITLGFGLLSAYWAFVFSVDDAFIVARYARNLAGGLGYAFNPGAPSDGVTGPLWLLPSVVGVKLGLDPMCVAKSCGLGCVLWAGGFTLRQARARAGGALIALLTALLLASSARLWIWSVAGLETGAATLCTSVLLCALLSEQRAWLVGVSCAALGWLRPELAFVVAYVVATLCLRAPRKGAVVAGWAALGAISVLAFRFLMFDHLLPLSVHAKPAQLGHGALYLRNALSSPASWLLVVGLAVALRYVRGRARSLSLALCAHACAVLLAGGDWMPGARLLMPLVPAACLLSALGFARLALRRPKLSGALFVLLGTLRVVDAYTELTRAHQAGIAREQGVPALLASLPREDGPIAMVDIGAVGYATERSFIDLAGLVEPRIAYARGGHVAKHVDGAWLHARRPAAIVLHSVRMPRVDDLGRLRWFSGHEVERRVLRMPWVWSEYQVTTLLTYQPRYFYVVLSRRDSTPR